jgi:hypothetical protein
LGRVFDLPYLNIEGAFVAALWTRVDAGRNSSGSELFSAGSAATLDTYVKVFKSGLRYIGIILLSAVELLNASSTIDW